MRHSTLICRWSEKETLAHNRKVVRTFARVFAKSDEWIQRIHTGNISYKYAPHDQRLEPQPRRGKLPPLPHNTVKRQPITHDYGQSMVDASTIQTLGEELHSKGITWLFSDDARNIGRFVAYHHEGKCFLPVTEMPLEERNYHPDALDIWICPVRPAMQRPKP